MRGRRNERSYGTGLHGRDDGVTRREDTLSSPDGHGRRDGLSFCSSRVPGLEMWKHEQEYSDLESSNIVSCDLSAGSSLCNNATMLCSISASVTNLWVLVTLDER